MRKQAPKDLPEPASQAARLPAQQRSRQRFEKLLDATAALLSARDMREVGIYDIARESGVPAASVYHFFPTPQSAFLELTRRRLASLRGAAETALSPEELGQVRSWADVLVLRFDRVAAFYNSDPILRQLVLSGNVIAEIRALDIEFTREAGQRIHDFFDRVFIMPYLPGLDLNFTTVIAIYDGVWMTSCSRHGLITAEFLREAHAAATAYCRTFLPEVLPFRPPET